MRCSKCGTESTSGRKFCPECGSLLSNRCAKCGADNSPTAKFCEDCGGSLGVASAASTKNDDGIRIAEAPAAQDIEGERKTVTIQPRRWSSAFRFQPLRASGWETDLFDKRGVPWIGAHRVIIRE